MEYIDKHYDEIECELNGEEYKETKRNRNLCIDCNVEMTIDYQKSTLVCTRCGLFEYYPRGGGRGIELVRPSEKNLDLTIIGPTKPFKM